MIQATELRIGNYTERNDMSIKAITAEDLVYLSKGEDITRIHPIPLTEEILAKCGFELSYKGLHTTYEINEGIVTYYFWDDRQYASFKGADIKCEYLHTLQNIYWCLCGKELEVNL